MIKQRRESIDMYRKGGRDELAATEAAEIAVIEEFLPKQMSDEEIGALIDALVAETGAGSIKEMGRVMALVKARHAGQLDLSKASADGEGEAVVAPPAAAAGRLGPQDELICG